MKRNKLLCLSLSFVFIFLSCAFIKNEDSPVTKTLAYSTSSLPTTIDLNSVSESSIRNYYSSLNNLSGTSNILKALKNVLSNNQKYYSYDSGDSVWKMYEITDRDWELSPANQITYGEYNATTNIITDYEYGSSTNYKNNPYLHALYVNRDSSNQKRAWGSHGDRSSEATIEREHIWPKSYGFQDTGKGGARGDPMHLWAADGYTNGVHNNFNYGYVDRTKVETDCGDKYSSTKYNYLGISKNNPTSAKVFEPQDSDKGDIARACFYMVARYNNYAGNDTTISTDNPNLMLSETVSTATGTSSTTISYSLGILADLLEWNKLDPVDEYEIKRNDILFRNFTNNRNPFIDFPEWADYIWGDKKTSSISPLTDPLHGGTTSEIKLTLSNSSISIKDNETATLTATTSDKGSYTVTWENSNDEVVSLSSTTSLTKKAITITPISIGTTIITASINLGEKILTAECNVVVRDSKNLDIVDLTIKPDDYTECIDHSLSFDLNKTIVSTNDLSVHYQGIRTGKTIGSRYAYTMYDANVGFMYSTSCPINYYPSKVTVNFSSGTGEAGKVSIRYGKNKITTIDTSATGSVVKSGSFELANSNEENLYWNFSTYGSNVQVASIKVTYSKMLPVITFSKDNVNGYQYEETSISASVAHLDGTLSYDWSTEDNNIASVIGNGSNAQIYFKYPGTTVLTLNISNGVNVAEKSLEITTLELQIIGEHFTIDYSNSGYKNGDEIVTQYCVISGTNYVEVKPEKNTGTAPAFYTTGNAARFYAKTDIKITSTKANLSRIKLIYGEGDGDNEITANVGYFSEDTWYFNENEGLQKSVTLTIGGSKNKRHIQKVEIYYLLAEEFASSFMSNLKCDSTGKNKPDVDWNSNKNLFNLLYDFEQEKFQNASGLADGTLIQKCVLKYDYIVGKYGVSEYEDFMGRNPSKLILDFNDLYFDYLQGDYSTIIIVACSITLMLSISVVYFYRKKKKTKV